MNNREIRLQITVCEVHYYKIRHINPVLAEVNMGFYHSLPIVQKLLEKMIRLKRLAMSFKVSDNINTTTTTSNTTSTITTPTPTTVNCTEKDI